MSRIIFLLFVLSSFCSLSQTAEIDPSSDVFRYVGRFDLSDSKKVKFAHSGNQIEFKFKGIYFEIGLSDVFSGNQENKNFFSIIINGNVKQVLEGTPYLKYHKIEVNSPDSFCSIEVFKRTEAFCAVAVFHGIKYRKGELTKQTLKQRRIEWIGDSFLVGYGNLVCIDSPPKGNPNTGFHSINQDAYLAFGAITSRFLKADFSCVGYSGKGVYRNFDKSEKETLPKIYSMLYPNAGLEKEYDFSFNPHLIVIKIGTNDFGAEIGDFPDMTDSSRFVTTYLKFLQFVTQKNPQAKIVLAVGGGLTDHYPYGLKRLTRYKSWVKSVKLKAEKRYSNRFGFFEFLAQNPPYGEDWHPTVISQQKFAEEITPYLREFMDW